MVKKRGKLLKNCLKMALTWQGSAVWSMVVRMFPAKKEKSRHIITDKNTVLNAYRVSYLKMTTSKWLRYRNWPYSSHVYKGKTSLRVFWSYFGAIWFWSFSIFKCNTLYYLVFTHQQWRIQQLNKRLHLDMEMVAFHLENKT